jgi:hypothetical protein
VREFKITDAKKGAAFAVHVVSRAKKNEIAGRVGEAIEIRLADPLTGGKANETLVGFLAEKLGVRERQLEIVAGEASENKMISVVGLSPAEVDELLLG